MSYSLRAANAKNDERPLFVLVDVVDDEPEARWLSVCFYADMVNDPNELGDFVPSGSWGRMPAASTLRKMIPPCVTISSPALASRRVRREITPGTECRTAPPQSGRDLSAHKGGRPQRQACSLFAGKPFPAGWCAGMEKRRPPSIKKDDAKQCCLLPIALPTLIEKSPGAVTPGLFPAIAGHQKRTLPTGAPPTR